MLHCDINVERHPQAAPKFAAGPQYILNRMEERPFVGRKKRSTVCGLKVIKNRARSVKSAKQGRQGGDLEKTLSLIKAHPGIRPSEINRLLNREESDGLRSTLIKRGLIRKEKDGSAMRYYPV
jgi:hypothetical protein